MTAFYQTTPSEDCMRVIREGFTPGMSQDGPDVDKQVLDVLPKMCEAGACVLYQHGDVVFMIRRHSAWIGIVDMFVGEKAGIFDAARAARHFLKWAADNTYYQKLEARSPARSMPILAKRVGAQVEGLRKGSFMLPDGSTEDEIEVGIHLRGTPCHKSH